MRQFVRQYAGCVPAGKREPAPAPAELFEAEIASDFDVVHFISLG